MRKSPQEPEDRLAEIYNKLVFKPLDEGKLKDLWQGDYRIIYDDEAEPCDRNYDRLTVLVERRSRLITYMYIS